MSTEKQKFTIDVNIRDFDVVKELVELLDQGIRLDRMIKTSTKEIPVEWFTRKEVQRKKFEEYYDKHFCVE